MNVRDIDEYNLAFKQHDGTKHDLQSLMDSLYKQFQEQKTFYCDALIVIKDHRVLAHSCVLSAASLNLKQVIESCYLRTTDKNHHGKLYIDLSKFFTFESFNFLASYIYKASVDWESLQMEHYEETLNSAKWCGFTELSEKIILLMESGITAQCKQKTIHNGKDENMKFLAYVAADCFVDTFHVKPSVNCMLCSQRLNIKDMDYVIKHLWNHKLQVNGVPITSENTTNSMDATCSTKSNTVVQLDIEVGSGHITSSSDSEYVDEDDDCNNFNSNLDDGIHGNDETLFIYNTKDDDIDSQKLDCIRKHSRRTPKPKLHTDFITDISTYTRNSKSNSDTSVNSSTKKYRRRARRTYTELFQCEICHKTFKYQKSMESHKKYCSAAETLETNLSGGLVCNKKEILRNIRNGKYSFSSEEERIEVLKYLEPEPKEKKTWSCPICKDLVFERKNDQVTHIKEMHGKLRQHICETCGKGFLSNAALASHIRMHTGEKPFMCSQCGAFFADKPSMLTHIRKHTGERPFLCTQCGKDFIYRQSLSRHMKFHEGNRPYKCDVCGKAFVLKQNLVEHALRHERNQGPSTCVECSQPFPSLNDLKQHRILHHNKECITMEVETTTEHDISHFNTTDLYQLQEYDVKVVNVTTEQ